MAEVKWIKLVSNLFDNRKVKQIRKMPEGDAIIVIWLQLLCLAATINDSGLVYFSKDIPYTDEMLSTEFDRPLNTIRMALNIFVKFNMVEIVNDILLVSNWEKYQNTNGLERIREQTKKRVAKHRDKLLLTNESNVTETLHVTHGNAIEKEVVKMGNRKYEIVYMINGLGKNKITVESKSENSAVAKFKGIMELSGIVFTSYFITEITYLK